MYDIGDMFSGMEVDPGTNLLIAGPPMTGKRNLAFDILASGGRTGDGAIVVTTKDNGEQVLTEYESRLDGSAPAVGVVDCVSKQRGMTPAASTASSIRPPRWT